MSASGWLGRQPAQPAPDRLPAGASRRYHGLQSLREGASSPQPSPPKEEREKPSGFNFCVVPSRSGVVFSLSSFGGEGWGEEAPSSNVCNLWYRRDTPPGHFSTRQIHAVRRYLA